MTSTWFLIPYWTTMHGQPHIKFIILNFVAHFVEALHYIPEGSSFHSQWWHRFFRPHCDPGVPGIFPGWVGGGGKGGLCVELTSLPSPCASCLEIRKTPLSWKPMGLKDAGAGIVLLFYYRKLSRRIGLHHVGKCIFLHRREKTCGYKSRYTSCSWGIVC